MKKFETLEAAYASQNYDPTKVEIIGVPEHHVEAVKAIAGLFVLTDAVNPDFQPDYSNDYQRKYENIFLPGSPSGSAFSFCADDFWNSYSSVGSRLVSESSEASRHVAELGHELYKAFMVYQRALKEESKE